MRLFLRGKARTNTILYAGSKTDSREVRQYMTINEIASMAGVSRTTVSRYLNNGYVSDEKAEKIRKVIEKTGYEPSRQAQMLRTKQTKVIGVILPKLNSDSISRMVDGISAVLTKAGYQTVLANTSNDEKEELKFLRLFAANGSVDGVILIGTILSEAHKKIIENYSLPLVILGQQTDLCSCVYYDDYNAAYRLMKRILQSGERVAYIGVTDRDQAAGHARRRAYNNALEENGTTPQEEDAVFTGFKVESGYAAAKELWARGRQYDSVFCATDSIAVGAMLYLREQNIRIPEDVQIVGTGDTEKGHVVTPALTTAHYYYRTSGKETARLMLGMLSGREPDRKSIKMGYKIIERGSLRQVEDT